ncbi:MAG: hypothetical protein ACI9KE_004760 [Polyangiales bacterium]|jgi:hypothetical protein
MSREIREAASLAQQADPKLAALVLDVVSRQAEGKTLFAGEEFVDAKRDAHGVEDGKLGDHDVLAWLRRGPGDSEGYALLMALAIEGLRPHLDDEERVTRFCEHADWLSFATDYPAYELVEPVLAKDATYVWAVVRRGLVRAPRTMRETAVQALRRAALDASAHGSSPSQAPPPPAESLAGKLERVPREGFVALLRLASGWALLEWIGRAVLTLVGYRRTGTLEQTSTGLRLEHTTQVMGRAMGSKSEEVPFASVSALAACTRFPRLALLLGTTCFALGVIVGGFWLFEGVRSGETYLLLAGAVVIVLGAGLDLTLTSLWPGRKGEVSLELHLTKRRGWRLFGLEKEATERFATAAAKAGQARAAASRHVV